MLVCHYDMYLYINIPYKTHPFTCYGHIYVALDKFLTDNVSIFTTDCHMLSLKKNQYVYQTDLCTLSHKPQSETCGLIDCNAIFATKQRWIRACVYECLHYSAEYPRIDNHTTYIFYQIYIQLVSAYFQGCKIQKILISLVEK